MAISDSYTVTVEDYVANVWNLKEKSINGALFVAQPPEKIIGKATFNFEPILGSIKVTGHVNYGTPDNALRIHWDTTENPIFTAHVNEPLVVRVRNADRNVPVVMVESS